MLVHRAVRRLFADQLRVIESHPYANVDSVGKVLSASVDSGDYEEICLANGKFCIILNEAGVNNFEDLLDFLT